MAIDIATGQVSFSDEVLSTPGRILLVWERTTSNLRRNVTSVALGIGTHSILDVGLSLVGNTAEFVDHDGGVHKFELPYAGLIGDQRVRLFGSDYEIFKRGDGFVVQGWGRGDTIRYVFAPVKSRRFQLDRFENINGNGIAVIRNEEGRVEYLLQEAEGRKLELHYDSLGRVEAVWLSNDAERKLIERYGYDKSGRLVAALNALGVGDRIEYDDEGRIARTLIKSGGVFTYLYDNQDRCVYYSGLEGYDLKRLRYIPGTRITEITNSLGYTQRYMSNENGQIVSKWNEVGAETRTEYDNFGRPIKITNAHGAVIEYSYDAFGNRAQIVDPVGNVVKLIYNVDHLLVGMTDAMGNAWSREVDRLNRITANIGPDGSAWRMRYDSDGNMTEVMNPMGAIKRLTYDHAVPFESTDYLGNVTRFKFDVLGNLIQRFDSSGAVLRVEYNLVGDPVRIECTDNPSARIEYDAFENVVGISLDDGTRIRQRFGPCNRLLEYIDQNGFSVRYSWLTEPQMLESLTNEKSETYRFFYDATGECIKEIGYDGRVTLFIRDVAGSVIRIVNGNGESIIQKRDLVGRLISSKGPESGAIAEYQFDGCGRLIQTRSNNSTVTLLRDAYGEITEEIQEIDGVAHTVRYDRNKNGQVTKVETDVGMSINFELNANSVVTKLSTTRGQLQFDYDSRGLEVRRSLNGQFELTQAFDRMGRLTNQELKSTDSTFKRVETGFDSSSQNLLLKKRYVYGVDGNLQSIRNFEVPQYSYEFDPASRLVGYSTPSGNYRYELDKSGNVTKEIQASTIGISVIEREIAAGDATTQVGGSAHEYDSQGRLVCKFADGKMWRYLWDSFDQLVEVQCPGGRKFFYCYDGLGRRIRKYSDGVDIHFVWQGDRLLYEFSALDSEWTGWAFANDTFEPVARISKRELATVICDQVGTPTHTVSLDDGVKSVGSDRPFGYRLGDSAQSKSCPFQMPGQYFDEETGFCYSRFRYYSPETFSFISQDPIGLIGGTNLYAYTPNPLDEIDPFGLSTSSDSAKLGQNLTEAGQGPKSTGNQDAHHIVMSNSTDPGMQEMRAFMASQKKPIDINDPRNGIWLPRTPGDRTSNADRRSAHKGEGLHGNDYKKYVYDKLMGPDGKPTKRQFLARLAALKKELGQDKKKFKTCRG